MLPDMRMIRPTLVVVADNAVDVVTAAGGWIADLAWSGWMVFAGLQEDGHESALRILGATNASMDDAIARYHGRPGPRVIAVSADSCRHNRRLSKWVAELATGSGEVRLWGQGCAELFRLATPVVDHRLSPGALAFKRQALETTGCPTDVAPVESFAVVLRRRRR